MVLDEFHQMYFWILPESFFRLRDLSREHSKQIKTEGFSALLRLLLLAAPRGPCALLGHSLGGKGGFWK